MKKEVVLKKTKVFGDYGKKRLLDCSASFQDLAKTFLEIPAQNIKKGSADKYSMLLEKSKEESRTLLAEHLYEMADIMSEVAQESVSGIQIENKKRNKIERDLEEYGIQLMGITLLVDNRDRYKLVVVMRPEKISNEKGGRAKERFMQFTTKDLGEIFSTYLGIRFKLAKGSVEVLGEEEVSVMYEEESGYKVLTGIARATKEGEKISGDNYMILEGENGRYYIALSDGAGSGEKANSASKMVVELLEKFIDAGFGVEIAIQMINGVLLSSEEEQHLSTLDICCLDTHTGQCEFIKVGACASYIKSDMLVEIVMSANLPLGVFYRVEIEKTNGQLVNGDYVIILSDGIIQGLGGDTEIAKFEEMLSGVSYESPQELANFILSYTIHEAGGIIEDDMTVLVLGIWENTLHFS